MRIYLWAIPIRKTTEVFFNRELWEIETSQLFLHRELWEIAIIALKKSF